MFYLQKQMRDEARFKQMRDKIRKNIASAEALHDTERECEERVTIKQQPQKALTETETNFRQEIDRKAIRHSPVQVAVHVHISCVLHTTLHTLGIPMYARVCMHTYK